MEVLIRQHKISRFQINVFFLVFAIGAMRAADGSRLTREETRSSCVRFSPTGREWAACTTDGLLLYSLDEAAIFNPSDLDETVTTEATEVC